MLHMLAFDPKRTCVGETNIKTNKVCQMTRRNEDLYHSLILHWKSTVRKNL